MTTSGARGPKGPSDPTPWQALGMAEVLEFVLVDDLDGGELRSPYGAEGGTLSAILG